MERFLNEVGLLAEVPLGTVVREVRHVGPLLERTLGGWQTLDRWGNPSGDVLEHHHVLLPVQVVRLDEAP